MASFSRYYTISLTMESLQIMVQTLLFGQCKPLPHHVLPHKTYKGLTDTFAESKAASS